MITDSGPLKDVYSYKTLADWLTDNCDPALIIAPGVTIELLVSRIDEMADQDYMDGLDEMKT